MSITVYFCVGAVALLNGTAAGLCAVYKAYFRYVGIVALAAFVGFLILTVPSSGHINARQVVGNFLWALPLPGFFGLGPGLLVSKGSAFVWTFLAGVLMTVIAAPIFLFYGAALSCLLMHECL